MPSVVRSIARGPNSASPEGNPHTNLQKWLTIAAMLGEKPLRNQALGMEAQTTT